MKRKIAVRVDAELDAELKRIAGDERGAYSRTVNAALAAYLSGKPALTPQEREILLALITTINDMRLEFAPVGSNFNQIAYRLNAGESLARAGGDLAAAHVELQDKFEGIRYVLEEILAAIRRL